MVHIAIGSIYDEGAREFEAAINLFKGLIHLKHFHMPVR
jgi:hypothetical protein